MIGLAGLLAACASTPKEDNKTVEQLYADAQLLLKQGNYSNAAHAFERLEARFPYGSYAQQAELNAAYAYFRDRSLPEALFAIDRFLKQHPTHAAYDYALYLKGRINYPEDISVLSGLVPLDMSERDVKRVRAALDAFREIVSRFPNSRYAEDARNRMAVILVTLADHELHVAAYYYRREAYLASAQRAVQLVTAYGNTHRAEPALVLLTATYGQLGLNDLRDDAQRVLTLNYPQSTLTVEQVVAPPGWWKFW